MGPHRTRRASVERCLLTLFALALTVAPRGALADPPPPTASTDPTRDVGLVIGPGHEREVLDALRPYAPGGAIRDGWSIGDVSIRRDEVSVELRAEGRRARMRMHHPSAASGAYAGTARFALSFEPDTVPSGVRDALVSAVRAHDRASLWTTPANSDLGDALRLRAGRRTLDGVALSLLALAFLIAALRRHLRETPRFVAPLLAAIGGLGLALRLVIAVEAPMNAWPYSRVVPLASAMYDGPTLQSWVRATGHTLSLVDLVFRVDLALAALTPLALFAHARAVLRDWRSALAAALLMATLPLHLRFSRSDVEFLQSLVASSLTFVALYGALHDDSRAWRIVCSVALPVWSLATYLTRPENMVFLPLDLAAIAVASQGSRATRLRVAITTLLVCAPAATAFALHLMARYRSTLVEALSLHTLGAALSTLVDRRFNTLINPSITPPWITLLAALGAAALWRRGERARSVFLVAWLGAFFAAHSYVRPHEVEMQARYHLHLVTPLVLLAAAAAPWLVERWRGAAVALAVASLAAPWMYLGFERDTGFYEMREFAFLRRVAARVPEGCTVIEFRGVPDARTPEMHFDSRWQRFASRLGRDGPERAWRVVTADALPRGARGASEVLSPEAREVLRSPPRCTMIYLGLSCVAQRAEGAREAVVCDALRTSGRLSLVARETITGRVYDSMNIGHIVEVGARRWNTLHLLPPGTPVELALYRYLGPETQR